jgi:DNA transformation protein
LKKDFAEGNFIIDYLRKEKPNRLTMDQQTALTQLPNIGKVVAEKLIQAGITSPKELLEIGSEQAFIRIQTIDETACFSMLQGLEGAVQGIRWHNLPAERKAGLREFFHLRRI